MGRKREIEFIIKPDGTVEESVTGAQGAECEKITEAIERELGEVTEREHTPDYFNETQGTDGSVTNKQ